MSGPYCIKKIPKLTSDIFQTKMHYSKKRQEGILLPDVTKQLKIRSFHPWSEYTSTSEALDLAIIQLVEGFLLSQMVARNIWDRMGLTNNEFSIHNKDLVYNLTLLMTLLGLYFLKLCCW